MLRPRCSKARAPKSFSAAFRPLSLDRRGVERAAFGLLREVRYQRDRRIGSELQFREAHLTEALPHSPLHGPQFALRDAVSGPGAECALSIFGIGHFRQILQPDPLSFFAVAGDAAEVIRSGAGGEKVFVGFVMP